VGTECNHNGLAFSTYLEVSGRCSHLSWRAPRPRFRDTVSGSIPGTGQGESRLRNGPSQEDHRLRRRRRKKCNRMASRPRLSSWGSCSRSTRARSPCARGCGTGRSGDSCNKIYRWGNHFVYSSWQQASSVCCGVLWHTLSCESARLYLPPAFVTTSARWDGRRSRPLATHSFIVAKTINIKGLTVHGSAVPSYRRRPGASRENREEDCSHQVI
jgi:hypothetical protein